MMEKLDTVKKQLSELAKVINEFKSEAVQLRVLEIFYGEQTSRNGSDEPEITPAQRKSRVRRTTKSKGSVATTSEKKNKAPAGKGAVASLAKLVSGSFFDKPRTIGDIVEHCKINMARTFKPNEFSGKLGRMVDAGVLTRKKNADNQYEYKKP